MSIISLQKDKLHVCACETPILSGLVLEVEICICCSCLVLSVHQIELVIYAYNGLGHRVRFTWHDGGINSIQVGRNGGVDGLVAGACMHHNHSGSINICFWVCEVIETLEMQVVCLSVYHIN